MNKTIGISIHSKSLSLTEHPKHGAPGETGQSLVELAVIVVLLLIIIAGVVEIGMIAYQYIIMHDAAQEGATYASIYPNSCEEIESRIRANLSQLDTSRMQIEILINGNACAPCPQRVQSGSTVQITVTDPSFPITTPFIGTFLGRQSIQIRAIIKNTIIRPEKCE